MQVTEQQRKNLVFIVLLLIASEGLCGCSGKPDGRCYASPEEVMAAEQAAYQKGDWNTYVDCFSAEAHEKTAEFLLPIFLAGSISPIQVDVKMTSGKQTTTSKGEVKLPPPNWDKSTPTEKAQKDKRHAEFRAMCAKHGLTSLERRDGESREQYSVRLASQIKDKRAFLVDLWEQIPIHDQDKAFRNQLTEVKIDGDSARGKFGHWEGKSQHFEDVDFKKIAGSWRIETPGIGH